MIGIICFWDRAATPYLSKYERILQELNLNYEVLFWDRENYTPKPSVQINGREITLKLNCYRGIKKIYSFLQWSKKIKQILKSKKYSGLIVLSTMPGFLLYSYIKRQYSGKFVFDIRDYTMEANSLFKRRVMSLIRASSLAPISSKGFMKWLDSAPQIMVNHNITIEQANDFAPPTFKKGTIRFSFVGNVRLDLQTEELMKKMGHDTRFEQHYFGRVIPSCKIEEMAKNNNVKNLYLHGSFNASDKPHIYQQTDLINTVYANAERDDLIPLGDSTPLPNRLYDAIVFYRPLVTSRGTYLAELSDQYHLGVNINSFDSDVLEQIKKYVDTFDPLDFKLGCDQLREIVFSEELAFQEKIKEILKNLEFV